MKTIKSRFIAFLSSIGALLGSCAGACGVACAASGCCGSYALFGFIGLSSSSLKFLEKLTPVFLIITVFSLAYAFYKAYKPPKNDCCETENNKNESNCCKAKKKPSFFQSKPFLWVITILVFIMWTYPYLSKLTEKNINCNSEIELLEKTSLNGGSAPNDCCPQASNCSKVCVTND